MRNFFLLRNMSQSFVVLFITLNTVDITIAGDLDSFYEDLNCKGLMGSFFFNLLHLGR